MAFRMIAENIRNDCNPASDYPPLVISFIATESSDRWQDDALDLLNVIKGNDFFICPFNALYLFTTESLLEDYAGVIANTYLLNEARDRIQCAYRGYIVDPPGRKRWLSVPDPLVDPPPPPPDVQIT